VPPIPLQRKCILSLCTKVVHLFPLEEIGSHSQSTLELHHPCEHAKSGNHVVEIVYISEANIYNKAGQHATADENMRIK